METYALFKMKAFEVPVEGLQTEQQLAVPGSGMDDAPLTKIAVAGDDYGPFMRFRCLHEYVDHRPRRLAGNPQYYDHSIVGGNLPFDAFYHADSQTLAMRTGRDRAAHALRALARDHPAKIEAEKVRETDFGRLFSDSPKTVIGSWFSGMKGNVKALGMFGDHVDLSQEWKSMQALGAMTALLLELSLDGTTAKVMISRRQVVTIYESWEEGAQLDFVLAIIPQLMG